MPAIIVQLLLESLMSYNPHSQDLSISHKKKLYYESCLQGVAKQFSLYAPRANPYTIVSQAKGRCEEIIAYIDHSDQWYLITDAREDGCLDSIKSNLKGTSKADVAKEQRKICGRAG